MGQHYENWIVIGISGVTCGGKTTLANKLKETLVPIYIFHQDQYFYTDDSPKHVKVENMDHNNYDILSSLDMEKMLDDVLATLNGVNKAHAFHENGEGRKRIDGKKILILEGFILLNYKPLFDLCNLRYYFTLEYEECVHRRSTRVYDPPDIPGYFEKCVWPEHVRYRAEIEGRPDITFVDGRQSNEGVFRMVMKDVESRGSSNICSVN